MRLILSLSLIILSVFALNPAQAGEIYQCGEPEAYELPTETIGVCDMYSRQLEYISHTPIVSVGSS